MSTITKYEPQRLKDVLEEYLQQIEKEEVVTLHPGQLDFKLTVCDGDKEYTETDIVGLARGHRKHRTEEIPKHLLNAWVSQFNDSSFHGKVWVQHIKPDFMMVVKYNDDEVAEQLKTVV